MTVSKFKFTERYFNDTEESIIKGTVEIHHSLTDEELVNILEESTLTELEFRDDLEYVEVEWLNDNYDVIFEKI